MAHLWQGKILVSTLLMVSMIYYLNPAMAQWIEWSLLEKITSLAMLIGVGGLVFVSSLLLLGIRPSTFKTAALSG